MNISSILVWRVNRSVNLIYPEGDIDMWDIYTRPKWWTYQHFQTFPHWKVDDHWIDTSEFLFICRWAVFASILVCLVWTPWLLGHRLRMWGMLVPGKSHHWVINLAPTRPLTSALSSRSQPVTSKEALPLQRVQLQTGRGGQAQTCLLKHLFL